MAIKLIDIQQVPEGTNLIVNRAFPTFEHRELNPFLLLDELGPLDLKGGSQETPFHPHAGFEILTYNIQGQVHHEDSLGNTFDMSDGEVQWMTAGSGIIHLEKISSSTGKIAHGIQLWINLKHKDKKLKPSYQVIGAGDMPVYEDSKNGFSVKIIAGEAYGKKSPIQPHTPIQYHHYHLNAGAKLNLQLNQDGTQFIHILKGSFQLDGKTYQRGKLLVLDEKSITLKIKTTEACDLIYISGEPIDEPIARHGPFVANSDDEIRQLFLDYQSGKFGMQF